VVTLRVQWGNHALTSFAGLTGLTRLGDLRFENTALTDLSHLAAASASGCELYAEDNENLSNADFVALRDALDPSQAMGVALYYNGNGLDGDGDGVPASQDCNDADGSEGEDGEWYWGPVDGDGDGVPRQYCSAGHGCLDSGGTPPASARVSYGDSPEPDCDDGDPNLTGLDGDGDGTSDCTDCNDSDPGVGFEFGTSGCPAVSCLTLRDQLDQVYGPQSPEHNSATYWIDPAGTGAFQTFCGMEGIEFRSFGSHGGWTRVATLVNSTFESNFLSQFNGLQFSEFLAVNADPNWAEPEFIWGDAVQGNGSRTVGNWESGCGLPGGGSSPCFQWNNFERWDGNPGHTIAIAQVAQAEMGNFGGFYSHCSGPWGPGFGFSQKNHCQVSRQLHWNAANISGPVHLYLR